jgi:hypothetical protein
MSYYTTDQSTKPDGNFHLTVTVSVHIISSQYDPLFPDLH